MTTVVSEQRVYAKVMYGGDPVAPTAAREWIVQHFDDGTHRTIDRDMPLSDLADLWAADLAAQRDAIAATAGEKQLAINALTAEKEQLTQQVVTLAADRDQWKAQYEALLEEIEPA